MANFKKMDDRDFIFVNKPLSQKEEQEFSDFLKKYKAKLKAKAGSKTATPIKKRLA